MNTIEIQGEKYLTEVKKGKTWIVQGLTPDAYLRIWDFVKEGIIGTKNYGPSTYGHTEFYLKEA